MALSASQTRQIFRRLLRRPAPSPEQIVQEITWVLRRNEEARVYHYLARTGSYPPPRSDGDFG